MPGPTQLRHPGRAHALLAAAGRVAKAQPGAVVLYMDASWPQATRPMPPHLSHGDGREVDLAVFFQRPDGRAMAARRRSPATTPSSRRGRPPSGSASGCRAAPAARPAGHPALALDAARTAALVRELSAERHVRRIFIEPHLKARLGFGRDAKVRFAGCQARPPRRSHARRLSLTISGGHIRARRACHSPPQGAQRCAATGGEPPHMTATAVQPLRGNSLAR
jgi:hypothetical protein